MPPTRPNARKERGSVAPWSDQARGAADRPSNSGSIQPGWSGWGRTAAGAGLPLTRAALSIYHRWREAGPGLARQAIEKATVSPPEAAALARLEQNLRECGPVSDWFIQQTLATHTGRVRAGLLDTLLAGIDLQHLAARPLVRIFGLNGWYEQWMERDIGRYLAEKAPVAPRKTPEPQPKPAPRAIDRVREALESRGLDPSVIVPTSEIPAIARDLKMPYDSVARHAYQIRSQDPPPTTETQPMAENAAPTLSQPGEWPWKIDEESLTDIQAAVWYECRRLGIRLDRYITYAEYGKIGRAVGATDSSAANAIKKFRQANHIPPPAAPQPSRFASNGHAAPAADAQAEKPAAPSPLIPGSRVHFPPEPTAVALAATAQPAYPEGYPEAPSEPEPAVTLIEQASPDEMQAEIIRKTALNLAAGTSTSLVCLSARSRHRVLLLAADLVALTLRVDR